METKLAILKSSYVEGLPAQFIVFMADNPDAQVVSTSLTSTGDGSSRMFYLSVCYHI